MDVILSLFKIKFPKNKETKPRSSFELLPLKMAFSTQKMVSSSQNPDLKIGLRFLQKRQITERKKATRIKVN